MYATAPSTASGRENQFPDSSSRAIATTFVSVTTILSPTFTCLRLAGLPTLTASTLPSGASTVFLIYRDDFSVNGHHSLRAHADQMILHLTRCNSAPEFCAENPQRFQRVNSFAQFLNYASDALSSVSCCIITRAICAVGGRQGGASRCRRKTLRSGARPAPRP